MSPLKCFLLCPVFQAVKNIFDCQAAHKLHKKSWNLEFHHLKVSNADLRSKRASPHIRTLLCIERKACQDDNCRCSARSRGFNTSESKNVPKHREPCYDQYHYTRRRPFSRRRSKTSHENALYSGSLSSSSCRNTLKAKGVYRKPPDTDGLLAPNKITNSN